MPSTYNKPARQEKIVGGPPKIWAMIPKTRTRYNFGCYPGQTVFIQKGLPQNCHPNRCEIIDEYDFCIAVKLICDNYDMNTSFNKASLMCGDVVMKDMRGRTLVPLNSSSESLI